MFVECNFVKNINNCNFKANLNRFMIYLVGHGTKTGDHLDIIWRQRDATCTPELGQIQA